MPTYSTEPTSSGDTETRNRNSPQRAPQEQMNYNLYIFQSTLNLLAHILIGVVVGIALLFALRSGLPLGKTPLHIVLCVTGYQLLMSQAILSLSSQNGWSSKLRIVDKRRAHWILQILGSGLALAGSFIKILDKEVHWNTYHGQFALVAMVFTVASLVNGCASLYAYEFRKLLNGNISKITHVCFGIVAFGAANITLCYGFDKTSFRGWASDQFTTALLIFVAAFTFIIFINPFITFYARTTSFIKKIRETSYT